MCAHGTTRFGGGPSCAGKAAPLRVWRSAARRRPAGAPGARSEAATRGPSQLARKTGAERETGGRRRGGRAARPARAARTGTRRARLARRAARARSWARGHGARERERALWTRAGATCTAERHYHLSSDLRRNFCSPSRPLACLSALGSHIMLCSLNRRDYSVPALQSVPLFAMTHVTLLSHAARSCITPRACAACCALGCALRVRRALLDRVCRFEHRLPLAAS